MAVWWRTQSAAVIFASRNWQGESLSSRRGFGVFLRGSTEFRPVNSYFFPRSESTIACASSVIFNSSGQER